MSVPEPSTLLNRIAAALGCSPEVFCRQNQGELAETLELLALWLETKDRPTRMRALMILRSRSGRAGASDGILTHATEPPDRVP